MKVDVTLNNRLRKRQWHGEHLALIVYRLRHTLLFDYAGIACLTHAILLDDIVLENMNHKLFTLRDTKALCVNSVHLH